MSSSFAPDFRSSGGSRMPRSAFERLEVISCEQRQHVNYTWARQDRIDERRLGCCKRLDISYSRIRQLDGCFLPQLTRLDAFGARLMSLNTQGLGLLQFLDLRDCPIGHLDTLTLIQLRELDVTGTALKGLNLQPLVQLEALWAQKTEIGYLDFRSTGQLCRCATGPACKWVDLFSCHALKDLDVSGSQIAKVKLISAGNLRNFRLDRSKIKYVELQSVACKSFAKRQSQKLCGQQ